MAEAKPAADAPVVVSTSAKGNPFVQRELNGATFLSLEHLGHMVLVVAVTLLIAAGMAAAISLWTGNTNIMNALWATNPAMGSSTLETFGAQGAVMIVSALLVLVPLLVLLDRRTRAEWQKRAGFATRLAYKLPVYGALAVLIAVKVALVIEMVNVVIMSVALIGTGSQIGPMYMNEFLPAAIALVIVGSAGWYVFKLAKGRDMGRAFSAFTVFWSAALTVALLITAVVAFHNVNTISPGANFPNNNTQNSRDFQDLLKY